MTHLLWLILSIIGAGSILFPTAIGIVALTYRITGAG